MSPEEAVKDPLLFGWASELQAVAARYSERFAQLTGVHYPPERFVGMAFQVAAQAAVPQDSGSVSSLAARRIAMGLPALASSHADAPDELVSVTVNLQANDARAMVQLCERLYGEHTADNRARVMRKVYDRGFVSLLRELDGR